MQYNGNMDAGSLLSNLAMEAAFNLQTINQPTCCQYQSMPTTPEAPVNRIVFPEIYYKVQPFIMMACDQMDTYSTLVPTQEMIEEMSDNIYEDVTRMYPDIEEYAKMCEANTISDPSVVEVINRGRGIFRGNFRRRGLFRDLISILLLSEFFRRRRRIF